MKTANCTLYLINCPVIRHKYIYGAQIRKSEMRKTFNLHSQRMSHPATSLQQQQTSSVAASHSIESSLTNEMQILQKTMLNSTCRVKWSQTREPLLCYLRQTSFLTDKFTQIPIEACVKSFNLNILHPNVSHCHVVCVSHIPPVKASTI